MKKQKRNIMVGSSILLLLILIVGYCLLFNNNMTKDEFKEICESNPMGTYQETAEGINCLCQTDVGYGAYPVYYDEVKEFGVDPYDFTTFRGCFVN